MSPNLTDAHLPRRKIRCEAPLSGQLTSQRLSHVWAASIGLSLLAAKMDKVTSAEIAIPVFIAKHNLPMAVGDEFGLLAKKIWCRCGVLYNTNFSRGV